MLKLMALLPALILCWPSHAGVRGTKLKNLARAEQALKERREALACQFALLSVEDMRSRLLDLMGQADKELAPEDYGSPDAQEYAFEIQILANQLIFKTSTSEKLALEAFQFAAEIAPTKRPALRGRKGA